MPTPALVQNPTSMLAPNKTLEHCLSIFAAPHFRSSWRWYGARRIRCDYSCYEARNLSYTPPGTQISLLNEVSFSLPQKSCGLIFGRSGSGKTTLLQLIAGLNKPTSGSIVVQRYGADGLPENAAKFSLKDTVIEEVTFGWPKQKADSSLREQLAFNLSKALKWVGLEGIPFDKSPLSLSGGYKRRLALAIQLVRTPELLILDEPLAGLDWKARADVVNLLKHLKQEVTLLIVSHDLKELASLVDQSWRMKIGGILEQGPLPS
ncbi:ABC transporter I family member 11, chloroplastic-like protein [Drosera capensis]